jgi:hypothetical protein
VGAWARAVARPFPLADACLGTGLGCRQSVSLPVGCIAVSGYGCPRSAESLARWAPEAMNGYVAAAFLLLEGSRDVALGRE